MGRYSASLLLVGSALAVNVLLLASYVENAVGVAACLQRAEFELILCTGPPPAFAFPLLAAATIALSAAVGAIIALWSSRRG